MRSLDLHYAHGGDAATITTALPAGRPGTYPTLPHARMRARGAPLAQGCSRVVTLYVRAGVGMLGFAERVQALQCRRWQLVDWIGQSFCSAAPGYVCFPDVPSACMVRICLGYAGSSITCE